MNQVGIESFYQVHNTDELLSPCLLVYPEVIRRNLIEMIRIAGGAQRLRPHVKTHKCAEIVRMELAAGITKHKCATLAEAEMLAECSAPDVLVAYPQAGPNLGELLELIRRFPATKFSVVVDNPQAAGALAAVTEQAAGKRHTSPLDVFIDLDTGMHRTGIAPGAGAVQLAQQIAGCPKLRLIGLHVYDGQNHQSDLDERQGAVLALMQPVLELVGQLQHAGLSINTLVCGGTPTFPVFADYQLPESLSRGGGLAIELSPGTSVLSDFNYGRYYRDMDGIAHAALLLTRVISKPADDLLTVDLGYKAVASDQPAGRRCHFPQLPDVEQIQHSEEHLVLRTPQANRYQVGDVLYAIPAHICPTVALHAEVQVIEGAQATGSWPVSARHRLYRTSQSSLNK
jgi:D-serine deaminase-like pyridoxal phosphate-dependent protein